MFFRPTVKFFSGKFLPLNMFGGAARHDGGGDEHEGIIEDEEQQLQDRRERFKREEEERRERKAHKGEKKRQTILGSLVKSGKKTLNRMRSRENQRSASMPTASLFCLAKLL